MRVEGPSKLPSRGKAGLGKAGALLLLLFVGFLGYLLLLYYSAINVEVSVEGVRLPGLADPLNLVVTRRLNLDVQLRVKGKGPLPVTLRSFSFGIYLEGVYVGTLTSSELVEIKPGESRTLRASLTLDLSSVSAQDLTRIAQTIWDRNGEVMVSLDGHAEVAALFFVLSIPTRYSSYVLLGPAVPRVEQMSWDRDVCEAGEVAKFEVVIVNAFRAQRLDGLLEVSVREDRAYAPDREAERHAYQLSLAPGERRIITGTFKTYGSSGTRGFFLKIYWNGVAIGEQPSQYPPRLKVVVPKGVLRVVNAYWIVSGQPVSSCKVGDTVDARVVLRAEGGPAQGTVTVRVRKDYALLPDRDVKVESYHINLGKGESVELSVTFQPDEPSGDLMRGYFIELEGIVSWTMANSYPPRLRVTAAPPPQGALVVESAWWTVGGRVVTTAWLGQTVTAHVRVRAIGGDVEELVRIKVRKDLALRPDEDYAVGTFRVKLASGQHAELTITFVASEKSGLLFRGYFIEVDFLYSQKKWTMEDRYPPRLKVEG
uniref:Late embryogenesis abundant protein LEA-2 subgroup domain-containing protein n=1 Tax=Thermofilum pendens TaxID=2269 RepID=A0A7C3SMU8_THEPE